MHAIATFALLTLFSGEPAGIIFETEGLISVIDEIEVPALREGVIDEVLVQPGDEVQLGEVVMRLADRDAMLREEAAYSAKEASVQEAKSTLKSDSAKLESQQAWLELKIQEEINLDAPDTVPSMELKRLLAAAKQADLKIKQANHDQLLADQTRITREKEWELAKNDVADHDFIASVDGVVVTVLKKKGEWVRRGDPVLRLARMDRFRVEAFFSSLKMPPHQMWGQTFKVIAHLPDEKPMVIENCKVGYVSHQLEANGDCRLWVEIDNVRAADGRGGSRWVLRPGMLVAIEAESAVAAPVVRRLPRE